LGSSATATPVRYRWSPDQVRWQLVWGVARHEELLTPEELIKRLEKYRSRDGDRLLWRTGEPTLEIGLPRGLASPGNHADVRVLALPGLYAESRAEQIAAKALLSRFAPVMNLVVFVVLADRMVTPFQDEAIVDNPYLSTWTRNLAGYRIVA